MQRYIPILVACMLAWIACVSAGACARRVQTAVRDGDASEARPDARNDGRAEVEATDAGSSGPLLRRPASSEPGGSRVQDQDTDAGPAALCARQTAEAKLQPTYLFVLLDVSGSMGKGDKPWHDRQLKWDPVVAATSAFFEDPSSAGFSAALTFFPAAGGDDSRCEPQSYSSPDVPVTALPSTRFREALDEIGMADWRGGTPTLYALQGVFEQIAQARMTSQGRYVVVLVTDGYPQDCDDDSIESVAELVQQRSGEVPTYVIGVANPPIDDAPDVTTNLGEIASAGGTQRAYLIDTGDPGQTVRAFSDAIDLIHRASVSCDVTIPAPPAGQVFDKQRVSASYRTSSGSVSLTYDAACAQGHSWRYDDPKDPSEIVLCPETCMALQNDARAALQVDFECEQVIFVPD